MLWHHYAPTSLYISFSPLYLLFPSYAFILIVHLANPGIYSLYLWAITAGPMAWLPAQDIGQNNCWMLGQWWTMVLYNTVHNAWTWPQISHWWHYVIVKLFIYLWWSKDHPLQDMTRSFCTARAKNAWYYLNFIADQHLWSRVMSPGCNELIGIPAQCLPLHCPFPCHNRILYWCGLVICFALAWYLSTAQLNGDQRVVEERCGWQWGILFIFRIFLSLLTFMVYYIMAGHAIVVVKDITLLFYHGKAVILTLW